jgi:anti-sigma factor RsiW
MADLHSADDQPHDDAEALLPWYATGQLEPRDRALVEDHLQSCVQCQQQLFLERRLIDEYGTLVPQVENGWSRLRATLDLGTKPKRPPLFQPLGDFWRSLTRPPVMGLVAAQAVFVLVGAGLLMSLERPQPAQYHALGSTPAPATADVIVMFQPSTTEQQMRSALQDSGASLVGGPTVADAYLLHVDQGQRPAALAKLRRDRQITMAQPIDGSTG